MKVYVDTSVFGGFFDREFSDSSKIFFDEIKRQRFTLVTSAVIQAEIEPSPENVRKLFDEMITMADMVSVDSAALALQESYLKEGREKIPKYNAVNILQGYSKIGIFSPLEVIAYENE